MVFNDYVNTLVYIKDTETDLKIVQDEDGEVNFLSQVGLGIAVHQGDQDLLQAINMSLVNMKTDGSLQELYAKWLNRTD